VYTCPICSKGVSTGLAPIHVKIKITLTITQNFIFDCILNFVVIFFVFIRMAKIRMDITRAITPPNFDGIERRITYANRKYHSGWMCRGATIGFAGEKFSTSPNKFGLLDNNSVIIVIVIVIGSRSFSEYLGLNFILSMFGFVFVGFEEPFSCNMIRCISIITMINIGRMKCSEKNRFNVGLDTEGPPQIHVTSSFPTIGIADKTPVITVAPQNDICPQGNTYPRNAVAIVISIRAIPVDHTFLWFAGDVKYIPRAVCMYIRIKNREAPFMWSIRVIHPMLLSRIIFTMM